ncbi:DNA topoisomerase IV, alpha subunit [Thermothelomyces heterothallicus CBS 203.75]
MLSASRAQQKPANNTHIPQPHSRQPSSVSFPAESDLVQIPFGSRTSALSRIEELLESIVDAITHANELTIPYETVRSSQNGAEFEPQLGSDRVANVVRFPGRTMQEVKKFEALFRIIEMSHEALLSGKLITKRNIYYQNPELFKSQSAVDDMVDNLAFTLGVGREDLNIVATAKGLISGPIDLILRDGSIHSCDSASDTGILLPSVNLITKINFGLIRWVLVIEKEATFRTLAAAKYSSTSRAGQGILLTAKGYPDLATRRFLFLLHSVRPELSLFALVDFDPHGIAIMRTYKHGSQRLEHEQNAAVPCLQWLGLHSGDVITNLPAKYPSACDSIQNQDSQQPASQESAEYLISDSQREKPVKRARHSKEQESRESILPLTERDRTKAVQVMREIWSPGNMTEEGAYQVRELQRMLMLNVKAEIQTVDSYGDIANWLDGKLSV